jgi:signal transduction histidine kinase
MQSNSPSAREAPEWDGERWVYVLAHELRGPLQAIHNAAALLTSHGLVAERTRLASRIIERQVAEMRALIDEVLEAARVRLGGIELKHTPVPVDLVVGQAVGACADGVALRGIALVLEPASEPMVLEADLTWLSRALQNLIVNASKYTDRGGRICVRTRRDGDAVILSVSDTGIGIDTHRLSSIFELGAQVGQEGSERSAGGAGIGLYVVRELIAAHGGTIEALSAGRGTGSEFVCRLPVIGARPLSTGNPTGQPSWNQPGAWPRGRVSVRTERLQAGRTVRYRTAGLSPPL